MAKSLDAKLWALRNSRATYLGCAMAFLFGAFLWPLNWWPSSLAGGMSQRPFTAGIWQECIATSLIAWGAYVWRASIRRLFRPQFTYIRAPLMLAMAPLVIARSREVGIADRHGLSIDLDFRYAGRTALDDLYNPISPCPFAVASDVALCRFLGEPGHRSSRLRVVPFVKITGHLNVMVRKVADGNALEFADVGALRGQKIGVFKDSVHEDYLDYLGILTTIEAVEMTSVLDSYRSLQTKRIAGCVLWEPHYFAFEKDPDVGLISQLASYEWYLYLVTRDETAAADEDAARRILAALRDAASHCQLSKNRPQVVNACAAYLHTEFTGIDSDGLNRLLDLDQHTFGVPGDAADRERVEKRLDALVEKGGHVAIGASKVKLAMWKGL